MSCSLDCIKWPSGGDRFLKLKLGLIDGLWLNWRPSGALRWKVKTVGWEGRGVVCRKPTPLRL
jgi:hypothetical protein